MTNTTDLPVNPPTPWEFLDDDEADIVVPLTAEEAAMHIETPDQAHAAVPSRKDAVVVHYSGDEHPEVIDLSEPTQSLETTASVDDLLIRQHYLPPDYD